MMKSINNKSEHRKALARVESLMLRPEDSLSTEELNEIRELGLLIQNYEQKIYVIAPPKTIIGMLEMKMYEFRLKQFELAKKLKVSNAKLSLILNGKQKPDVEFLKAVHKELKVDADFLLKNA